MGANSKSQGVHERGIWQYYLWVRLVLWPFSGQLPVARSSLDRQILLLINVQTKEFSGAEMNTDVWRRQEFPAMISYGQTYAAREDTYMIYPGV